MKEGKIRWSLRKMKRAFAMHFDYFKSEGNGFVKVDIEEK